jgi:preprotein translocase subunit SecE
VNRETKRMMQRQGQMESDGTPSSRRATPTGNQRKPAKKRTSPAEFLREVRDEMRQVAWPSRPEMVNYTSVVLFTLVFMIGLIFLLNLLYGKAVVFLFQK